MFLPPSNNPVFPTDADLARAAQRGDKRAFVGIVVRHQAMVCGVALGILHDFAASEDAAQEAFLNAWRKIEELREPDALRAWLAQIARHAALGHLRRTRRTDNLEEAGGVADAAPMPDEQAASREEAAMVELELSRLPENYRLPLVLFYRQDQSVAAVAETLQISEDAVKQRLSRGRDLLRERMSGLIEAVLVRPRASAIFTITIATTIGALMAPAAIAGTVFSTLAATGAAASGATSAPLVTAMTTSKLSLTTAAIIALACLPVGYAVRVSTEKPLEIELPAALAAKVAVKPGEPTFNDSLLFAEWRKLHDEHGTDASAMPVLFQAIADLSDPFRRRAFRSALLAEWAIVDPAGGMAYFANDKKDWDMVGHVFREWFSREPQAALASLMQLGEGWKGVVPGMLTDIARQLPGQIPALVDQLPKAESYWDGSVREAFVILAEKDPDKARAAAEALTGPNREKALSGIAKAWGKTDGAAAIAWAKNLADGVDRDEIIRAALTGMAQVNPAAALGQLDLVPPGGRDGYFATTTGARVLKEAAEADFEGTLAWLAANPRKLGHEDLMGLADTVTKRLNADPAKFLAGRLADQSLAAILPALGSALMNGSKGHLAEIWDWVKNQTPGAGVDALKTELLQRVGYTDRDLALRMARDLPAGKVSDPIMQLIAQGLINGGSRLYLLDDLLKTSPPGLQDALIAASFNGLQNTNFDNPQVWLERLRRVPETQQLSATMQLASVWAAKDPQGAINWTRSLSGNSRENTLQQILVSWVHEDSLAASQWITTLPPGTERDAAAAGLVSGLAHESPDEAWPWALNISDPQKRSNAVMQTLQQMKGTHAKEVLQSGPFTPEEKQSMQEALDQLQKGTTGGGQPTLPFPR